MKAEYVVGRLLCGRFRDMLKEAAFEDHSTLSYIESSGLIDRKFVVKGSPEELASLRKKFMAEFGN